MRVRLTAVAILLFSSCALESKSLDAHAGAGQGVLDTMDGTVSFSTVPCADVPRAQKRACRFPAHLSRYLVVDLQLAPGVGELSVRVLDCGSQPGQGDGTEGYFCLRPSECDLTILESLPRVSPDQVVDACFQHFGTRDIALIPWQGEAL